MLSAMQSPQVDETFKPQVCTVQQCLHCSAERLGTSNFCTAHKCMRCDAERVEGDFCPGHWPRCRRIGCNLQNPNNWQFCKKHQCRCCFEGCVGSSSYCRQHKCTRCDAQRAEGFSCMDHLPLCRRIGCNTVRQQSSQCCIAHQCTVCAEERDCTSNFCTTHKCTRCDAERSRGDFCTAHWPRCLWKGCNVPQPDNSQSCAEHQCKSCTQGRDGASDFCISHRCTLCNRERKSAALCEEHRLTKFAPPQCDIQDVPLRLSVEKSTRPVCPICLEEIAVSDSASALSCAHLFHSACAWQVRSTAVEAKCPVCRRPF